MNVGSGAVNVELHIEELVLHGFAPYDRQAIAAALQQALARLLHDHGVPPALTAGGRFDHLYAGAFNVAPGMSAQAIGVQVAEAVYGGLSR